MVDMGVQFEPEVFATFEVAAEEQPCMPLELAGGREGIVITAPSTVRSQSPVPPLLPVCGRYRLAADAMATGAPMQVYLRQKGTATVLSGVAPLIGVEHPENLPEGEEEEYVPSPGLLIGGTFAFDAQAWLAMKAAAGGYELWVSQAGAVSNVVEVTITTP